MKTLSATTRRPAVRLFAVLAVAAMLAARGGGPPALQAQVNPIVAENLLPGDTDWDVSNDGDPTLQGFASDISVNKGTTVSFKIKLAAAAPASYVIDVYRLGYYQGLGARKVGTVTPTAVQVDGARNQPACVTDPASGLVDCGNWAVSGTFATTDLTSGIFVARPRRTDTGGASHIIFIVRDDARQAEMLMQTSDTTWQAYNRYGGNSLYFSANNDAPGVNPPAYSSARRAYKVSYNRPFDTRAHDAASFLFSAEYPMVRFMEANGYDVKYWAGVDTHRRGADLVGLVKPKAFLSVGHDEYWSGPQRTRVEDARNAGVHLAFFSGNEVYWKTRYEPSIDGSASAYRTLVCYKETLNHAKIDPTPEWTGTWRDRRFSPPSDGGRPENALMGAIWTVNSTPPSGITVPASMAGLRLWRNTRVASLTSGSVTLGTETLGYEWGEDLDNGFRPTGLMHLSSTTVAGVQKIMDEGSIVADAQTATHNLTLYRHNSGALVFGASTVQWSWGLDGAHDLGSPQTHPADLAMQQATVNLLADMGVQPGSLYLDPDPARRLVLASASTDMYAPNSAVTFPLNGGQVESGTRITITGTSTDLAGPAPGVVTNVEVSVDGGTTWRRAQGTSTWSFEWSPGLLGPATIKVRGVDDSGNLEAAGSGITVTVIQGDCPCTSLWKPSTVPANTSASDTGEYELGVKFTSDIAGFITGIRFYKGAANNGTHVGNLWSATGEHLASAVFVNETATGWQQVNFGTPVAITANTTYVASYHTPNGGYAYDPAYFTASRDAAPLHAPASATSGGNGVFSPGGVAFPTQSFNANNYWVDVVFAQSLDDTTPPVISAIKATAIDSARATVSWATDEQASSRIDYGTDSAILTASITNLPAGTLTVTKAGFATQHTVALAGLQANTTYYFLITAIDHTGNTTTVAAPTFTVPGPTLRDTASTDFAAGTTTATYVSQTADGEVRLAPTVGAEFDGPALPRGWVEMPWVGGGYSVILDGVLLVDGARVATCVTDANGVCVPGETATSTPSAIYTPPHSLEFSANFSGDQFQHAGFAVTFGSGSEPWAIFSTLNGGLLHARTNTGNGAIDTPIGVGPLGEFHRFRIDWKPASVDYYIDGALVVSHAVTLAGPMRPVAASDFNPFGGIVFVDWMRMTPVAAPGTFVSRVFDANSVVSWNTLQWAARTPAGTGLALSLRTGNTLDIDGSVLGSWTAATAPGALTGLASRYIQYRAEMTSTDPGATPELEDIIISTGRAPVALPDFAAVAQNGAHTFPASGAGSLVQNDTDADAGDTLRVVAVTAPAHGTAVVSATGAVTYTPVANYNGPDAFTYTVSDGLLTATATVTLDVRFGNIPPVANNDFYNVNEDTTLTVGAGAGLLANDTDFENDPRTAALVTLPLHGMLTLGSNGAFSYTPALNYAGPDAFTYRANDGTDSGNIATVQILVNQVNDAPITEPDAFTAMLNQALDVPAPGLLANDHDIEIEDTVPMTAQLVSGVSHGQLTFRPDGSFRYVPNADFLGTDSFTYVAVDHFNAASLVPRTVTLTVALKAVTQAVASGTVSTGVGVSAGDPLNTAVTTPVPATVAIAQGVISGSQSPAGYTFLNQQVNITLTDAAGAEVTATAASPLVFTFEIDLSLIPAGQTAQTFEIFRNNVRVPNCLGATTIPAANLDPCVSDRSNGTKVALKVLTTHASHWNVGMEAPTTGDNLFAVNDGPYLATYQTPLVVGTALGALRNDLGPTSLTAALTGTPVGGSVVLAPLGGFTFTPAAGFCGAASFEYELRSDTVGTVPPVDTATVSITVNCNPVAGADATTVLEDSGSSTITVLSNDSDPDGQTPTITGVTQGANGAVVMAPSGTWLTYAPAANFFGADSFTYTITDGRGGSATGTVNVTVTPVNDVPSFAKGADRTAVEDSGPASIAGWATLLSGGPANESGQALSFLVTNTNNTLFVAQPAIAADGTLVFTPAADASGSATVSVRIQDDGGTADSGIDTSAAQTFVISITAVNDAPSFSKGANQSLFEDTGAQTVAGWATGISVGPADESAQTPAFTVTTDNAALFSVAPAVGADGTLTFDPAPNAVGVANVTVTLKDNGGTANGGVDASAPQTFSIALNLVNDAPAFTKGANPTVLEDSGASAIAGWATGISAGPADESGQGLNFIVSSDNPALFSVQPSVSPLGTLTFTPAANANGSATVTVRLHDDGGTLNGGIDTSAAQTFTISVTAVNDAPAAAAGVLTTAEDTPNAGTLGGSDLDLDALLYSVVTNGTKGTLTITNTATGAFTYTPNLNANGTDTITFKVKDAVLDSNVATLTVTITPVNDAPVATGGTLTVTEDASQGGSVVATDVDNSSLTYSIVANGAKGTATITPATGAISYVPNANAFGSDSFSFKANDGTVDSNTATVTVTINPVNDAPAFTAGANQAVYGAVGVQTVSGWATAITAGPGEVQALDFIVSNNNNALFTVQPAISPAGTLTYTPVTGAVGVATVSVQLHDNGGGTDTSAVKTFTISVNRITTATTLVTNRTPSLFGVPVTFTATVAITGPGVGPATGTVAFKDGTTTLGTVTLTAGSASFTTSTLAVGTHPITAVYTPALPNFAGSTSPALTETITPSAVMQINFTVHAILDGTNKPKVQDAPVPGAIVRVYSRQDVCTNGIIVSGRPKMWGPVFDGLDGPGGTDPGCPVVSYGSYQAVGVTDANGNVNIIVPPTVNDPAHDYVVIARTTTFDYLRTPTTTTDPLYSEKTIRNMKAGVAKKVLLHQIATFSGKLVPGKDLEEYGSYLAIVEPDFIDWTEAVELYPIVLVAEGEWSVTTGVVVPEGFVAEEAMLSTDVADTTEAIQFTIIDVGSDWSNTKVSYDITHKGKKIKRESKIPMFNKQKPKAKKDQALMMMDSGSLLIPVLQNDRTMNTLGLTLASFTQPVHGHAAVSADGQSIIYTPGGRFTGTSRFAYSAIDGAGNLSTATIEVAVLPAQPEGLRATGMVEEPHHLAVAMMETGGGHALSTSTAPAALAATGHELLFQRGRRLRVRGRRRAGR